MEKMRDFFTARVQEYDEHMLNHVKGCREAYIKMAELVPKTCQTLLDLGCGTGLELDRIFQVLPDVHVTGIDLTQAMLNRLKEKYPERKIQLICGDYFTVPLGDKQFDCAISFQTMHHFSHQSKLALYQKIFHAVKTNGIYIECDYMVEQQEEEEFYAAQYERLQKKEKLPSHEFFHFDIPCTIQNQIKLLRSAGFSHVEQTFRIQNTTILLCR